MKTTTTFFVALLVASTLFSQTIPSYLPQNGLVAWYPFNGNANDESGNGNNGTVSGATLTTDRNGDPNKAYNFNGTSDYIVIPHSSSLTFSNNSQSICFWIYLPTIPTPACCPDIESVINKFSDSTLDGFTVHFAGNSALFYSIKNNSSAPWGDCYITSNQYSVGTPIFVSYTNDNDSLRGYINGQLKYQVKIPQGTNIGQNSGLLYFGRENGSAHYFNGKLDDIAIYNRDLTLQEITALYTGLPPCVATTSTTNTSICPNAIPYIWNGLTFNSASSQTVHLTNANGCDSAATLNLTITSQPSVPINNVCVGSTIQLTNIQSGGVWSYNNNRATVNQNGLVTGTSAGIATIKYRLPNGNTTIYTITVNAKPIVPSIGYSTGSINPQIGAGTGNFCINKTFGVVGIPSGGVFVSSNNSVITIDCNGIVNTVGLGNASLTYTYTNPVGCSNSRTITGSVVNCIGHRENVNTAIIQTDLFTVYPNPAHSQLNLSFNASVGAGTLVIADLYGKQLKAQSLSMSKNIIDIKNLAKGLYVLSVITNQSTSTKKLIVE